LLNIPKINMNSGEKPNSEPITLEEIVESTHGTTTEPKENGPNSHRDIKKFFTKNKLLIGLLIGNIVLACVIIYLLVCINELESTPSPLKIIEQSTTQTTTLHSDQEPTTNSTIEPTTNSTIEPTTILNVTTTKIDFTTPSSTLTTRNITSENQTSPDCEYSEEDCKAAVAALNEYIDLIGSTNSSIRELTAPAIGENPEANSTANAPFENLKGCYVNLNTRWSYYNKCAAPATPTTSESCMQSMLASPTTAIRIRPPGFNCTIDTEMDTMKRFQLVLT